MDGDRGGPYWMYGVHQAHDEWWQGPLHVLFALVLVALVVIGIVWLARRMAPSAAPAAGIESATGAASAAADPAVAELRLRYARGQIDRDGYLQSFADLTGRPAAWPGQASSDAPTATPPAPAS